MILNRTLAGLSKLQQSIIELLKSTRKKLNFNNFKRGSSVAVVSTVAAVSFSKFSEMNIDDNGSHVLLQSVLSAKNILNTALVATAAFTISALSQNRREEQRLKKVLGYSEDWKDREKLLLLKGIRMALPPLTAFAVAAAVYGSDKKDGVVELQGGYVQNLSVISVPSND